MDSILVEDEHTIEELIKERDALLQQLQLEVSKNEALRQQVLEQDISMDVVVGCSLQEQAARNNNVISELKRQIDFANEAMDKIRKSNNCSICFSPWEAEGSHRIVSLKCGHLFGDSCIRIYLGHRMDCPICKSMAKLEDLRYLYGISVLHAVSSENLATMRGQE